MLREAFNDKADLQRLKDHNYAIGGKLEDVGRIATNAHQEHRTDGFKEREDKKKNEAMMRLLRQQELMKELDGMLGEIDGDIDQYRENDRNINRGVKLLKEDNVEGMILLLKEQGRHKEGMSDEDVRNETRNFVGDTIDDQRELQTKLEKAFKDFETNVEGLDKNSPEYAAYKELLEGRRAEYKEIASGNDALNYEEAEKYVRQRGEQKYSPLAEEKVVETVTRHQDQEDGAQANIEESTPTSKSGGLFGDVKSIKNEYNAVASGESLEVSIEENLESDLDNSFNQPSLKGPTL